MYDVMIIGAGPSGMTAAVYAARKKLHTLLISKDIGGQTNWTNSIENYMGYQFIEGPELIEKFENQVKQFPIDLKIGDGVSSISLIDKGFEIRTESGQTYQGKTGIIATGKRPRSLNIPGEEIVFCLVEINSPVRFRQRDAVIPEESAVWVTIPVGEAQQCPVGFWIFFLHCPDDVIFDSCIADWPGDMDDR